MIKCKECNGEISEEADKCPKCGHPNSQYKVFSTLIGLVFFGIIFWYLFGGGLEQQATDSLDTIKNQVAEDSVRQYNIAKSQGDLIQICVQAGMVSAAYLQANDQSNYNRWKRIEKEDCRAAGLTY